MVRVVGLILGVLAAAGVLLTRRALVSTTDTIRATEPGVAQPVVVAPAPGRALRVVRIALGTLGVVVMLVGVWKLLHNVSPQSYWAFLVFLLGAVVLHDAVLAPVVNLLRYTTERRLPLPAAALAVLKGGFVVAGVLTLVAVPAVYAKHLGPLNPTVLPGSYGGPLVTALVVVAVLSVAGAVGAAAAARKAAS